MRTPPAWRMAARSISRNAPNPCCAQPGGRERGQAPALALGAEQVRRRADGEAEQDLVLPRPAMAAAGIGADGEVGDQADRHAGRARRGLRRGEAAVGAPLHVGVERDLVGVAAGELGDRRVVRDGAAPRARCASASARAGRTARRGCASNRAWVSSASPRSAAEGGEGAAVVRREAVERLAQRLEAAAGGGRPVDQLLALEEPGLVVLRPVERGVQDVEVDAAGGRVGAEAVGVGGELGVHRADGDAGGAVPGGRGGELAQRLEVAEPGVAAAPQRVELDRERPGPGPRSATVKPRRGATASVVCAVARSRAGGSRATSIAGSVAPPSPVSQRASRGACRPPAPARSVPGATGSGDRLALRRGDQRRQARMRLGELWRGCRATSPSEPAGRPSAPSTVRSASSPTCCSLAAVVLPARREPGGFGQFGERAHPARCAMKLPGGSSPGLASPTANSVSPAGRRGFGDRAAEVDRHRQRMRRCRASRRPGPRPARAPRRRRCGSRGMPGTMRSRRS